MGRGMSGHQLPAFQTAVWLTPPNVLAALGRFDLDPCAAPDPRPWDTATIHYTLPQDGLRLPWDGRVWLNPPYGGPAIVGPWLRRMARHDNGIMLTFARTETALFHESVWQAASAVFFFAGRLHFHYPDGVRADNNAGAPSCLAAYGASNAIALQRCALPGHMVMLRSHVDR
jgi:hypothetical protein